MKPNMKVDFNNDSSLLNHQIISDTDKIKSLSPLYSSLKQLPKVSKGIFFFYIHSATLANLFNIFQWLFGEQGVGILGISIGTTTRQQLEIRSTHKELINITISFPSVEYLLTLTTIPLFSSAGFFLLLCLWT